MPLNGFKSGGGYVGPRWKTFSSGNLDGTQMEFDANMDYVQQFMITGEPDGSGTTSSNTSVLRLNLWTGDSKQTSNYTTHDIYGNGTTNPTGHSSGSGIPIWWDNSNLLQSFSLYGYGIPMNLSEGGGHQWYMHMINKDRRGNTGPHKFYFNAGSGNVTGISIEYSPLATGSSTPIPGSFKIWYTDETIPAIT